MASSARTWWSYVGCSRAPLLGVFTDLLPEDKEFFLKEQTEGINKFWTVNEVRELRGLDPVPGGEVLYQPQTLLPLTKESAEYHEPVAPLPADDSQDGGAPGDGSGDKPEGEKARSSPAHRPEQTDALMTS